MLPREFELTENSKLVFFVLFLEKLRMDYILSRRHRAASILAPFWISWSREDFGAILNQMISRGFWRHFESADLAGILSSAAIV